ncbi:hypothetical protein CROQUDRAFT_650231 [Cronartium quercuum f. sp. fusiforme G11]|uniref:Programmed cell death protein 2 C-terminal domain-containing protein n=1 Tax=Cronartium quercuum f. sp. fusiforme G11 TaxID=708437 RepID=A0A9P6THJ8_9BASI|nr:hypothetical protein CROQUDRAFT_650231 [Cronartium quercuum f. sp. fusiforme G11]
MRTVAVDWHANESDASDAEDQSDGDSNQSFTSKHSNHCTDYILAFEDGQMCRASDQRDWNLSRLAGTPAWLPFKTRRVGSDELKCRNCEQPLYQIAQIYCVNDLKDAFDRVLHLFGCSDPSCQVNCKKSSSPHQCLRAFRSWQLNHAYQAQHKKAEPVPDLSLNSLTDNPFKLNTDSKSLLTSTGGIFDLPDLLPTWASPSDKDTNTSLQDPIKLEPEFNGHFKTQSPSTPDLQQPSLSHSEADNEPNLPSLSPHYLTTCYEAKPAANLSKQLASLTITPTGSSSRKVKNKLDQSHSKRQQRGENEEQGEWKGERYERQTIEGVDETFLTFQERVSWCGQLNQVIRYKPGGKPLPFTRLVSTPTTIRCETCGSVKAFELQFMPVGVTLLNGKMPSERGFTWSTAWVLTCEKDCHGINEQDEEGWLEESVYVQWED